MVYLARQTGAQSGVVFAMRYGSDVGYVWLTIARQRDLMARELGTRFKSFIAYPQIGERSAYSPQWSEAVCADFYTYSAENLERLEAFIRTHQIRLVVFMS